MTTLRDQICQATDALRLLRQSRASYDDMKAAAIEVLTLRQQAEQAFSGRIKTRITAQAIASLLRG